jgi:hypothetical protein
MRVMDAVMISLGGEERRRRFIVHFRSEPLVHHGRQAMNREQQLAEISARKLLLAR